MTDIAANRASTSRSLPPPTPSTQSPVNLHSMSTRSSEALARRQSIQQQQDQQQLAAPGASTSIPHPQHPEPPPLPSIEGRLTRKRARSINVEEANYPRVDGLSLQSPGLAGAPSSTTDLICICPSPPKVPRPRNGMYILSYCVATLRKMQWPVLSFPNYHLFLPSCPSPGATPETQLRPPSLCSPRAIAKLPWQGRNTKQNNKRPSVPKQ